jgi:hypothetical protein
MCQDVFIEERGSKSCVVLVGGTLKAFCVFKGNCANAWKYDLQQLM